LAGAEIPKDRVIDGRDIWNIIRSEKMHNELSKPFYYYNKNQLEAVRYGDWKYHQKKGETFLYNLRHDHGESKNIITENPEIEKELLAYFNAMEHKLGKGNSLSEECRPSGFVNDPKVLEMQDPKSPAE
jgi:arylsulfatase A-like enzyme